MPSRRGHEVGQTIEKLPRREINDAVLSRGGGLALSARADPCATLVPGQRVADAFGAAVAAREQEESLEREGGPGTIPEEALEALEVARHVAVQEGDADARVDGEAAVLPGEHVGGFRHGGRRGGHVSLDLVEEDLREGGDGCGPVGEDAPQSFRHRDHPLPARDRRDDAVSEVRGRLGHTAAGAGRADAPALAGKRD
jgi:hypothetical protein